MTGETLLSVQDLRIAFRTEKGTAKVLDGASLEIGRGQILGLVGESGCGKSTLARAVLSILAPNAIVEGGNITFENFDLLTMPTNRFENEIKGRRITFVPQDPYGAFNPVFRIGPQIMEVMKWKSPRRDPDEIGFGAFLTSYPAARKNADKAAALELLEEVQIPDPEHAFNKLPGDFSGGQRQRLLIAMALMTDPDLIIADEPTTALDVTIQAQVLKLLKQLARQRNVSVLLTTHDLGTAYEICDAITVMYAGQDVETASVSEFFANPRHPYTAKLLESLPQPGREIREIPGEVPNLLAAPSGCRFHPRCERATIECTQSRPHLHELPEHSIRCFHPLSAAAEIRR